MLSVPKSDNTGIADGQLSLDIGDLVSACSTEADLSQKVQALSISDKFAYLRQHSKPAGPQPFEFPRSFIGGCKRSFNYVWLDQHKWLCYSVKLNGAFCMHAMFAFQWYVRLHWQGFWCTCHQAISDMAEEIRKVFKP